MSFLHTTAFLAPSELQELTQTLDALHPFWTRRAAAPLPIYTLGAATYLDARTGVSPYKQLAAQKNTVLKQHFGWLHKKLIDTLTPLVGSATLEKDLALPGFHIFGEPKSKPLPLALCNVLERTPASVHIDTPYKNHFAHWLRYKDVDFLNALSMTVCLERPQHGAGLNTWQTLNHTIDFHGHPMVDDGFDRKLLGKPTYLSYESGWLYISMGHIIHQIAPCRPFLPTDRRITLQAHAVRCDGIWRLFF